MRKIILTLDPASIDQAYSKIRQYQRELPDKLVRLRKMIAERVAWSASSGFRTATAGAVFGRLNGGKVKPEEPIIGSSVQVTVTHYGDLSVVFAEGDEAVFIEYGAGVYFNGSAGSSPHPWGSQFGYAIGTYGKGHGKRNVWGYSDGNGGIVLTHGTPAAMPLYNGLKEARAVLDELILEVFGDD